MAIGSTADTGRVVRFNVEAKAHYLRFAQSAEALWSGNFRDLSASITRLATLAEGGRIGLALVEAELQRLRWLWQRAAPGEKAMPEPPLGTQNMDLFDRLQLEAVLGVCRQCKSLSEAGRMLFGQSRTQRSVVNDADRLRKYLQKWGLVWEQVAA